MAERTEKKGYRALARYLLISPFKVRRIATNVRKKPYSEAIAILESMPHKGARLLKKVISSAAANALYNNKKLDEDMLFIKELQVNEGPRMKRLWPRARGRADRLLKRMTHILVVLDEVGESEEGSGTES
jgi:large subunit ribosomal protein L22